MASQSGCIFGNFLSLGYYQNRIFGIIVFEKNYNVKYNGYWTNVCIIINREKVWISFRTEFESIFEGQ